MIDRPALLKDLQTLLKRLEADLLQRSESAEVPEVGSTLRAEYERAKKAERTAANYEDWRSDAITQAAAAWVLSCVFVRFLEDNRLIEPPKISGHSSLVPGHSSLVPGHSSLVTGHSSLVTGPKTNDKGQMTKDAKPATNDEGQMTNDHFRMIDPACGSGHFLLGSFRRILERWRRKDPSAKIRDLVQRTLDSIHGVDVNPYAVAIARFRLLLACMQACGVTRMADAPDFRLNLVCGDSLLHGAGAQASFGWHDFDHVYRTENQGDLVRILKPGHYHAVVGNPPYITPKDKAQNDAYRERYSTCHRQYSLAVPFMQRLFQLAQSGYLENPSRAGFVGQITANSFMKREFGKKLIEDYFAGRSGTPGLDLTHVIDTSGAYIPGHGTPTVILFGRQRAPVAKTIRTVMGIRGEPTTPDDPSRGLVWSAIVDQIDQPGSHSDFVSVGDSPREAFHKHPWSIGGGGAAELKEQFEVLVKERLGEIATEIGFVCITKADEFFTQPLAALRRSGLESECLRPFGIGEQVRDWWFQRGDWVIFPYDENICTVRLEVVPRLAVYAWPYRTELGNRVVFGGQKYFAAGKPWYEYGQIPVERAKVPWSIAFAFVATHNHFIIDRGGKVFKQSAPVIKLPAAATEDDHIGILGLLNSSTACFWMKHNFQTKGSSGIGRGVYDEKWESFYEYTGTGLGQFPLPSERPVALARELDSLARAFSDHSPSDVLAEWSRAMEHELRLRAGEDDSLLLDGGSDDDDLDLLLSAGERLRLAHQAWLALRGRMIALQEELDWQCYRLYGLTGHESFVTRHLSLAVEATPIDEGQVARDKGQRTTDAPPLALGQRAFEIVLARKVAAGELQTTWFERHGSTPISEIPADWPEDYQRLVERRIELIETDPNIALIERPEYKRRWNTEPWESQLERALREWLLDRLETYFDFDGRMSLVIGHSSLVSGPGTNDKGQMTNDQPPLAEIQLATVSRLSDVASHDGQFMAVAELYRDDRAFNVERLVAELVEAESVPLLPILRYKPSGLRKRAEWERTWELQREEDRRMSVVSRPLSVAEDPGQLTTDNGPLTIPVPPKYTSADFISTGGARYWNLRGKLDVPKERWVSFPHCEGPDGTLVIAWAGYDHLQLARSISAYYVDIQERLGGRDDPRLVPLLGCLLELLPWLKQWHNEVDPEFGERMGDYFEGFISEEARQLGKTIPEIKAWEPVKKTSGRKKK